MKVEIIDLIKSLGIISIGSFSIVGLFGFIFKGFFENYLKNRLEEHKNNLTLETEKLKKEFELEKAKNIIKFTKIHEQRANLIIDLYSKLVLLGQNFKILFSKGNITNEANKEIDQVINLYQPKKLYFNKDTVLQLDQLIELYKNNIDIILEKNNYTKLVEKGLETENTISKTSNSVYAGISDMEKDISNKIEKLLENLECQFKEILGIE